MDEIAPEAILESLRWKEDMVITNHDGDRVWLKECFSGGKRIGITDCCFESDPCEWHRALGTSSKKAANMTEKPLPAGVTAVYVYDGRVIAHASDFDRSRPGGFTVLEAQTHRVEQRLAVEVVRRLSSQALYENLDAYDCEKIVAKMKGKRYVLPVGHSDGEGAADASR